MGGGILQVLLFLPKPCRINPMFFNPSSKSNLLSRLHVCYDVKPEPFSFLFCSHSYFFIQVNLFCKIFLKPDQPICQDRSGKSKPEPGAGVILFFFFKLLTNSKHLGLTGRWAAQELRVLVCPVNTSGAACQPGEQGGQCVCDLNTVSLQKSNFFSTEYQLNLV